MASEPARLLAMDECGAAAVSLSWLGDWRLCPDQSGLGSDRTDRRALPLDKAHSSRYTGAAVTA
jgi:hypothetical protein